MKYSHTNKKTLAFLALIMFSFAHLKISADPIIYKSGTKFGFNIKWWGLSAYGTMEMMGKTKINDREALLVRSESVEVAGVFAFVARLLRIYNESNMFDTYIDLETLLPIRYEVYKLEKNGSKKVTEHILFDRKHNRVISYDDKSTILSNVPPELYDTFSLFLKLIHRLNTEDIFIGKRYDMDIYMYREIGHIKIRVISQRIVDGQKIYTFEIDRLPDIFKYPASLKFEIGTWNDGLILPLNGECTIDIPVLSDITLKGDLIKIK